MSYTPGPWFCEGTDIHAENLCLATVHRPRVDDEGRYMTNGEANANARLIANAPDLVDRLEECCDWLGHLSNCTASDKCVDAARDLLRHVKGGV